MAMKKNGRKATRNGIQRALLRLRRNRTHFITCASLPHDAPDESTSSGGPPPEVQILTGKMHKKRWHESHLFLCMVGVMFDSHPS